jgi:hypothetical protein
MHDLSREDVDDVTTCAQTVGQSAYIVLCSPATVQRTVVDEEDAHGAHFSRQVTR